MSFVCCGVKYDKNDINTYWCIETYKIRKTNKIFECLICKKCGAIIIKIGTKKIKGKEAIEFLNKNDLKKLEQKIPFKKEKSCKTIPLVYGKFINEETQRARYINELDWADKEIIKTKIVHLTKP